MSIQVVTLNTWLLPWGLARQSRGRLQAIATRIGELPVDVIALQEVWTDEARGVLREAAARAGFAHHWHRKESLGGSGLMVLSRAPIQEPTFHRFALGGLPERLQHSDYWGGKGFVLMKIVHPEGVFTLLGTHLHGNYSGSIEADEYRGMRAAEIVEIAHALREVTEPVIAVGDFNLLDTAPVYRILVGLTGLEDAAAILDAREPTVVGDNPYRSARSGDERGSRIDYVFTRRGARTAARPVGIRRTFDEVFGIDGRAASFSDHAGLWAEIVLEPASGTARPEPSAAAAALARQLFDLGRGQATERREGRRIGAAAAALLALGSGALAAHRPGLRRRQFMRPLFTGLATLFGLGTGGLLGLSEWSIPAELAAFAAVEAKLDDLSARG